MAREFEFDAKVEQAMRGIGDQQFLLSDYAYKVMEGSRYFDGAWHAGNPPSEYASERLVAPMVNDFTRDALRARTQSSEALPTSKQVVAWAKLATTVAGATVKAFDKAMPARRVPPAQAELVRPKVDRVAVPMMGFVCILSTVREEQVRASDFDAIRGRYLDEFLLPSFQSKIASER